MDENIEYLLVMNKPFKSLFLSLLAGLALSSVASAATITDAVALRVEGFEIPIMVVVPEEGVGPFPVVYHVHGGGWNGGTDTTVPEPSVPSGFRMLSDQLGVIHVGLAYRGKVQGTFSEAMDDLRASVKWVEARADDFNADLSRVGLSGGSAGTPLSALLAQEIVASKTYVGLYGVYNLLNNEESLFPSEEARSDFGINDIVQKRAASVFHNLRAHPPAALLFHGAKDILTHRSQSIRYAKQLETLGASAEAIIYPEVNHGFFSERYPVEFKQTLVRVAQLYADHLGTDPDFRVPLERKIDQRVAGYFPQETIEPESLFTKWRGKNETFEFVDDSTGVWSNGRKETRTFAYRIRPGSITLELDGQETTLYMQKDGRALYKITENDERRNGQRFHFTKLRDKDR